MTINKDLIAGLIFQINHGSNGNVPSIIRKIDEAVQWAWDNWDANITETYYEGEKPSIPTEEFINQWVENEDFEADGYDMEELAQL